MKPQETTPNENQVIPSSLRHKVLENGEAPAGSLVESVWILAFNPLIQGAFVFIGMFGFVSCIACKIRKAGGQCFFLDGSLGAVFSHRNILTPD